MQSKTIKKKKENVFKNKLLNNVSKLKKYKTKKMTLSFIQKQLTHEENRGNQNQYISVKLYVTIYIKY